MSPHFNPTTCAIWQQTAEACCAATDPDNPAVKEKLAWAKAQRAEGKPTIPSSIGVRPLFPDPLSSQSFAPQTLIYRVGPAASGMG